MPNTFYATSLLVPTPTLRISVLGKERTKAYRSPHNQYIVSSVSNPSLSGSRIRIINHCALFPASQRELLNTNMLHPNSKNSVTAEISPFVCELWPDILCWKDLSLPYSEGRAWLAYTLLFASQPFNHLKYSGSLHTSEMCWLFFTMCPSLFTGELHFSSCAWLVRGAPYCQEIRANCQFFFFAFSLLYLCCSSLFEDYVDLHAFYTECFSS